MHNERLRAFYSSKCCHHMKEDEMEEACSPHWRDDKCIQNFDSEACRKANASKSWRRCEESIRIVLKKTGLEGMDWIHTAQSKVHSADPSGRAV